MIEEVGLGIEEYEDFGVELTYVLYSAYPLVPVFLGAE